MKKIFNTLHEICLPTGINGSSLKTVPISMMLIGLLFLTSCKKAGPTTNADMPLDVTGTILYQLNDLDSRNSATEALYSIELNNAELPIKPLLTGRHFFRVSPNGKTIAYIKYPQPLLSGPQAFEIHSMPIDASSDIMLRRFYCRQIYSLDWAPDNHNLVFDYYGAKTWSILTMKNDGTALNALTDTTSLSEAETPRWSPDGSHLACLSRNDSTITMLSWPDSLVILSFDGSGRRRLSIMGAGAMPEWSPDGQKIAFSGRNSYLGGLYIADLNSSTGAMEVKAPEGQILFTYCLQWLSDNRILCIAENLKDSTYSIDIVPPNSSAGVQELVNGFHASEVLYTSPSVICSPDGQTIAIFGSRGTDGLSLYIMRPDGSGLRKIRSLSNSPTASWYFPECADGLSSV